MSPERDVSPTLGVKLTAWAVLLILSLVACEAIVRAWLNLFPPLDYRLIDPRHSQLTIFKPSDGPVFYGVRPNHSQRFVRHDFDVRVRTNGQGFREDFEHDGRPLEVAFAGDSFGFGWGVEAGERFSDRVREAFPDRAMLNLAYPNGHAPPYYLAFLNDRPELLPEVLVVMLFAWNDLGDDQDDARLVRDADGRLVRVESRSIAIAEQGFAHSRDEPVPARRSLEDRATRLALVRLARVAAMNWRQRGAEPSRPDRLSELDRGQFSATAVQALGHLEELDALVRGQGGELLVFYVPFANFVGDYPGFCQYAEPVCRSMTGVNGLGEALAGWAAGRGIEFIDPVPDFRRLESAGERLYFEHDAHWTPAGHRAAGDLIVERLSERLAPRLAGDVEQQADQP